MNLKFNTDSNYFFTINSKELIPELKNIKELKNMKSFDSENLEVDYICFNFKSFSNLKNQELNKLCQYLFTLGFNSFDTYRNPILTNSKNQYDIHLVKYSWSEKGFQLRFSGKNAKYFYSLIKKQVINWKLFSEGILARFDLCFDRVDQQNDTVEPIKFLHSCSELIKKKYKRKHKCTLKFGLLLTINKRKGPRYIRIYRKKELNYYSMRFEYELKKEALKTYQYLLFSNKLYEFEDQLSKNFILYLAKVIPLKFCFTDWLVLKKRSIRKFNNNNKLFQNKKNRKFLQTHYLKSDKFQNVSEQKKFILFLQFLAFTKRLNYAIEIFGFQIGSPVIYRLVCFKVQDFFLFKNPGKKSINYYQVSQLEDFLDNLKEFSIKSVIDSWYENEFQILTYIPMARVFRDPTQQNCLIAQIYIAQDLFDYNYPYILPDFFTNEKRFEKDRISVGFEFMKTISSKTAQKKFLIKKFLEQYKGKISNQRIANMKRDFIKLTEQYQKQGLLENTFEVLTEFNSYPVAKLKIKDISYGFIVYEKL